MRRRYIVLNPSISENVAWIQGDIVTDSPVHAVESVESNISAATANKTWEVFPAPDTFPAQDAPYSGGDASLLAALRSGSKPCVVPNGRFAEHSLALAC
jgi:hypothetical protein